MKLFPLLLTGALLAPSAALASPEVINQGCRNRCGDTTNIDRSTTNIDRRTQNIDRSNNAQGGEGGTGVGIGVGVGHGGQGGAGGRGGRGGDGGNVDNSGNSQNDLTNQQGQLQGQRQGQGQRQSSENRNRNSVRGGNQRQSVNGSGNSENSNTNTSRSASDSRSSANNNGNAQTTNINTGGNTSYGDLPETAIAPLPGSGAPGQIGDIVVPLPSVTGSVFGSGSQYNDLFGGGDNDRLDYGATIGINIPLGAGRFREYAEQAAQARADRAQFRLIQEAVWLRQQGLLSEETHPRHWAALNGN